MKNIAEFQIIGRVGSIKTVGPTLRVSVCANYPVKDDAGECQDHPHWSWAIWPIDPRGLSRCASSSPA